MSGRIKLLLALLAAGAGLTFWHSTRSLFADTPASATIAKTFTADATCSDQDGDGLCDYDETYWSTDFNNPDSDGDGFKDGEEVISGHDPAKAGPNDAIHQQENLTQKASKMILGAMLTGDIADNSATYEASVQKLIDLLFQQYDANTAIDLDSIVKAPAGSASTIQYSAAMSRILTQMMPEIQANELAVLETIRDIQIEDLPRLDTSNPEKYTAFIHAIDNEISAYNERVNAIKSVRVPTSLVSFHTSLIQYLRGAQQQYRMIRTITKDPVQGLLSLQVLHTLASETSAQITESFTRQVTSALP